MLAKRVLILSEPNDVHTDAVAYALRRKGHECDCLLTPDLPTLLSMSVEVDPAGLMDRLLLRGPGIAPEPSRRPYDVVWMRRHGKPSLPEDMHPGDREVALWQCEIFLDGVLAFLADEQRPETFWVNPLESVPTAVQKPFQLRAAVRSGLLVPETLISNDPDEIRAFIRRQGGVAAHKLLRPASWVVEEGAEEGEDQQVFAAYTVAVTEDQLPDDAVLRLCPGIFQPFLEKSFEVRVACLGDHLVAVRIHSQDDDRAASDWRAGQTHIEMEPYELPREVADACRRLLRRLNLVHASLDFVVDPQGRHIFLESNAQGMFLFLETRAGLPMLDLFSEFLLAGTRDFQPRNDHEIVRFSDYETVWQETWQAEAARHVQIKRNLGAPDLPDRA